MAGPPSAAAAGIPLGPSRPARAEPVGRSGCGGPEAKCKAAGGALRHHLRPAAAAARSAAAAAAGARATAALDAEQPGSQGRPPEALLDVRDLTAAVTPTGRGAAARKAAAAIAGRQVLQGVTLAVQAGEAAALMGRNGSGKTTLAKVLAGSPEYHATGGSASFKGQDLLGLHPEERGRLGLFLSFQAPVEVPGVAVVDFLWAAVNARRRATGERELDMLELYSWVTPKLEALHLDPAFLNRGVNQGFSGGERKLMEVLQLACLEPDLAILDEIDSGLDVDAMRDMAAAVNALRQRRPGMALLIITHYRRLLDMLRPDSVHIMQDGRIVRSGGMELVERLEAGGYGALCAESQAGKPAGALSSSVVEQEAAAGPDADASRHEAAGGTSGIPGEAPPGEPG